MGNMYFPFACFFRLLRLFIWLFTTVSIAVAVIVILLFSFPCFLFCKSQGALMTVNIDNRIDDIHDDFQSF